MPQQYDFVATPEHWDAVAKRPDWFRYVLTQAATWSEYCTSRDSILFRTQPRPDWVLVDLGCGGGRIAKWASPRVRQYIGLDVAPGMIERARQYCEGLANASFVVSDTLRCLRPASVDCILSERVFIHLPRCQQAAYVAEAFDVLKPGGLLLLSMPGLAYVNGWTRAELLDLFGRFVVQCSGSDGYLVRAVKGVTSDGRTE